MKINFINGLLRGAGIGIGAGLGLIATALLAVAISGKVHEFESGETISSSLINENFSSLKSAIEGLPDCSEAAASLHIAGPQTLNNSTITQLTNVTEVLDTGTLHDPGLPGQFTVPTAGKYYATGFVYFPANASGSRYAEIRHNATLVSAQEFAAPAGAAAQLALSGLATMAAGDTLTLRAQQSSGGVLNVTDLRFSVFRICSN